MDEMSNAQTLNKLKEKVKNAPHSDKLLEVLKQLEMSLWANSKAIRSVQKLFECKKVCIYYPWDKKYSFNISADELKNMLFGFEKKEAFYKFINRIYGEKAEQLLRTSGLGLEDIYSLEIFDEDIIKKIEGKGLELKEIVKLKIDSKEMLDNYIVLSDLQEMYRENQEISSILEKFSIDPNNTRNTRNIIIAEKLLKNKRIAENINADILNSIINHDANSYNIICELVGKTYGKEAEEILRERPKITIRDIPNFHIFDENIREMIGYGGVHTFLTYYMDSEDVITYLANNLELARYYKEFEELTKDYFPPSACGLEERLIAFYENKDLIREIIDSGYKNRYKENLLLFFEDKKNLPILSRKDNFQNRNSRKASTFFPENDLKVESLVDLAQYNERRETTLRRYWEEDKCYKKDLISFKYFGRLTYGMLDNKDMEKFLSDYVKLNQTSITNEELDLIELFLIFNDIQDEKVLEDIDKLLSQKKDVITPLHIRTISYKIAENYKKEYLDSLVSVEKAKKMSEESEKILDSKTDSIQKNEASENLARRYILKKDDENVYYSDHMETPDGVKKYRDCIVMQKDNTTIYTFIYRCQNGEEIIKRVIREKDSEGNFSEQCEYKMRDMVFGINNGEIKRIYPEGEQEHLENFIQTYEQRIKEGTLVPQYNPEEKFKLEKDDVEGFILHGVHHNEICISLIRMERRPTSMHFNYGELDRTR